jgi:hypothetical protein
MWFQTSDQKHEEKMKKTGMCLVLLHAIASLIFTGCESDDDDKEPTTTFVNYSRNWITISPIPPATFSPFTLYPGDEHEVKDSEFSGRAWNAGGPPPMPQTIIDSDNQIVSYYDP